jgi:hypothetical protein
VRAARRRASRGARRSGRTAAVGLGIVPDRGN